jgi:hypothetical protein
MRGEYQPDANDQPQPLKTVKAITSRISEIWPELPPHGHLHVFVSEPDEVDRQPISGEWFFLLVLGPFGDTFSVWTRPGHPCPSDAPTRFRRRSRSKALSIEATYLLILSSHMLPTL